MSDKDLRKTVYCTINIIYLLLNRSTQLMLPFMELPNVLIFSSNINVNYNVKLIFYILMLYFIEIFYFKIFYFKEFTLIDGLIRICYLTLRQ